MAILFAVILSCFLTNKADNAARAANDLAIRTYELQQANRSTAITILGDIQEIRKDGFERNARIAAISAKLDSAIVLLARESGRRR